MAFVVILSFKSTLVRLEVPDEPPPLPSFIGFKSTLVRLEAPREPSCLDAGSEVSSPPWFD